MTERPHDANRNEGEDVDNPLGGLLREFGEDPGRVDAPVLTRRQMRESEAAASSHRRTGKRSHRRGWVLVLVALVALGGLGTGVYLFLQGPLQSIIAMGEPAEFSGDGTSEATLVIDQGDTGLVISQKLEEAGVVKSASSFYSYLLALNNQPTFQPGTYMLRSQMSNMAALAAVLDDSNRSTRSVTVPEGYTVDQIFVKLEQVGFSASELAALRADPQQFGLPADAIDLEGFLFPATYTFDASTTATQALQAMVTRSFTALDALGVAKADRMRTVILASLIKKEAGSNTGDMAKIARVFLNRLDDGMLLQSDATVAYGVGSTGTVWTTAEQRADESNRFNTYVHAGLPPGAISNPGDEALEAALKPADGTWLFFTVVNLETGETIFSNTDAEHIAAVAELTRWCQESDENAAYCA